MDIYKLVGQSVREERKRAGLTIQELSGRAGISMSFLSYIETQGRKASLDTIQKLAGALRIPVAQLFKAEPGPEKDAVYGSARQFMHLLQDRNAAERAAILEAVKALSRAIAKKKKK